MAAPLSVMTTSNKLPQLIVRFPSAVRKRAKAQVEETEREVRANIVKYDAIDTRLMLTTVVGQMTDRAEGMVSVPAVSEEGYPYPAAVNYGTVYMPARPFFSEAVDKSRDNFFRRFDDIERDIL